LAARFAHEARTPGLVPLVGVDGDSGYATSCANVTAITAFLPRTEPWQPPFGHTEAPHILPRSPQHLSESAGDFLELRGSARLSVLVSDRFPRR
jgi:hypothetical protein